MPKEELKCKICNSLMLPSVLPPEIVETLPYGFSFLDDKIKYLFKKTSSKGQLPAPTSDEIKAWKEYDRVPTLPKRVY